MSKSKYLKGDRIYTLDELEKQEFIMFNGKVYHKGFWRSWQYQYIVERLNGGQIFKAVDISKEGSCMFVCYEENYHLLALDCGPVSCFSLFSSLDSTMRWFKERSKEAVCNGYVFDKEDDIVIGENEYNEDKLKKQIEETGVGHLTVFLGYQDNFDEMYVICVRNEIVQK